MTIIKQNKLLAIVLIVAAILRFVGTNPGYNQFHADEGITYSAAASMVKNGNLDPLRYDYPSLVPITNYFFFKTVFIPIRWIKYYFSHIPQILDGTVHIPIAPLEAKKILQIFVLGERERNTLFWGRYVTALFSLGNVFLAYLLGKKLFNKKVALIGAFLLAFNYKHVTNSHVGLPDIYNSLFLLCSFLTAVSVWKKPNLKNYLLAGIATGLSFSVKYQIFAIFPILTAHFLQSIQDGKIDFKRLINIKIFISFLLVPLIFLAMNPYHLLYFDKVMGIVENVSKKYGMGSKRLTLFPFSYMFHIDYGPVEFILVFLGVVIAIKKYFKQVLILFSFLLPFFYVVVYYSTGGFYVRNFINVSPLFLLFAGVAIWQIYEFCKNRLRARWSVLILLLLLLTAIFVPAKNSIINSYYYTKAWNYSILKPWLKDNLPKDAVVATHPFDASNLGIFNKRTEFEESGAYSLNEHKENGANYALIDLSWAGQSFYFWMSYGFDNLRFFWNKPLDMMRNTFYGIATEELFRYQVKAVTKPWQAVDTLLVVSRFYNWPQTEMRETVRYDFDEGLDGWTVYCNEPADQFKYGYDKNTGYENKGSVVSQLGVTRFPGVRLTSEAIPIKVGHLYKISGYLKTELNLKSKERDGFIRIDFYGDDYNLSKVGIISSVSARVYGTDTWVQKEIVERAPSSSKYMTVSFQTNKSFSSRVWLDNVTVEESEDVVEDITSKQPYNIRPIDLNYVYPNSHGNM